MQAQTWRDWELIVIDDGSTDGSTEAVQALGDSRIRVLSNRERRGAGYSRSRGALETVGEFIAFLDSDDYWLPTKLERQVMAASNAARPKLILAGPMLVKAGDSERVGTRRVPMPQPGVALADLIYAYGGTPLQTSGLMVSGELGRSVRFDCELRVNQDTDYLLRLEAAGAELLYLDEPLYVHDASPRLDRISVDPELIDESMAWYRSVSSDWSPQAHCGYHLNDAAIRFARAGRYRTALEYYVKGFCWHAGPYHLIRQFLLVLGGGEMPNIFGSLWRLLSPLRPRS